MNYYWLILPAILISYVFSTLHVRYESTGDQLMKAWYVRLPGWSESYYPEHKVDLSNWVGSNLKNISIEENGVRNPELEAAATLKALNIFSNEYTEKKIDGHWFLFKPEKTEKYFSWTANYRVSQFAPLK